MSTPASWPPRFAEIVSIHITAGDAVSLMPAFDRLGRLLRLESVIWVSDAVHRGEFGVLAISDPGLAFVPLAESVDLGFWHWTDVLNVDVEGDRLDLVLDDVLETFADLGEDLWAAELADVIHACVSDTTHGRALAEQLDGQIDADAVPKSRGTVALVAADDASWDRWVEAGRATRPVDGPVDGQVHAQDESEVAPDVDVVGYGYDPIGPM